MPSTTRRASEFSCLRSLDGFDVVADAGGGLGGLDEDGAGFELEGGFDFVEGEGLAVGFFDDVGVAAEGFDEGGPALAEFAGCQD